ncbi:MAG: DUF488 domain-containing protein [Planctomycetes bacterium]|nr:DUF488 domain-containing protein [Planctomycetota bacterium]
MSKPEADTPLPITIFTIGFAGKSAREFFAALTDAGVRVVVDIRLNNQSQLAGFTKKQDLEYFLQQLGGLGYDHRLELAPTKEILDAYRKKVIDWAEYERRFHQLLLDRQVETLFRPTDLDGACLLCSEPTADQCHRRVAAEYLRDHWRDVTIRHL